MLSRLSPEEATRLRDAIRQLGESSDDTDHPAPDQAPDAVRDDSLASDTQAPRPETDDGVELVLSDLASRARPAETTTPSPTRHEASIEEDPWLHSLCEAEPETIAGFLEREAPAAIALVLSHLPSDHSAAVLSMFDDDRRADVLLQLSRSGDADPAAVRVIATELANWIQQHRHEQKRKAERIAKIQSILKALPPSERGTLVERLGEADEELGVTLGAKHPLGEAKAVDRPTAAEEEVAPEEPTPPRPAMPVEPRELIFARLTRMDAERLLAAARTLPARTALLALAELPPKQIRTVHKQLSRKASQDLQRRLSTLAPVRLRDIEASQRALHAAIRHAFHTARPQPATQPTQRT